MKNVVFITIDCLRQDVVGCYDRVQGLTPFMDSLSENVVVFSKAHSVGPYTKASFPALLASAYPFDFGWQEECPKERVLISEVLGKEGIASAGFHSNPYLSGFFKWNRGWFVFMDSMNVEVTPKYPYLKGDQINKRLKKWISFHAGGSGYKPFFVWIHYMDVHEPYVPSRRYLEMVDPSIRLSEDEMFGLYKDYLLKRDVSDRSVVDTLRKLYYAHVLEVDSYVKEVFDIFKEVGVFEDTAFIITADHGDEFGEHGSLSHDSTMYSELVQVPLLIYNPQGGSDRFDQVVSTLDIPPTITELFGVRAPEQWQGKSLFPLGEYQAGGAYGEAPEKTGDQAPKEITEAHYFREDAYKIIYRESSDSWELYDISRDPAEKDNIAESCPRAGELQEKVKPRIGRSREC